MIQSAVKIINNSGYQLNVPFIRKLAAEVMDLLGKTDYADIEVIFLNDRTMRRLNKEYKASDRFTDVLSFKLDRSEFGNKKFLGEIFISVDRARAQSAVFRTGLVEELVLYVIHGILHLFGYDDADSRSQERMWLKQAEILKCLGNRENLSRVLTTR